jgi:hypothetical protein
MDINLRKRRYTDKLTLYDADTILSPPAGSVFLCLSLAQTLVVRASCRLLHQRTAWVKTYLDDGYLIPDDADWDTIEGVIADAENELMGCNEIEAYLATIATNTAWQLQVTQPYPSNQVLSEASDGSPIYYLTFDAIPEGYWRYVGLIVGNDLTTACTHMRFEHYDGSTWRSIYHFGPTVAGQPVSFACNLVLVDTENIRVRFYQSTVNDNLRAILFCHDIEALE